jgi:hypothetical protein
VQAGLSDKNVRAGLHNNERFGGEFCGLAFGQTICLLAGRDAEPATDTSCRVHEDRFAHKLLTSNEARVNRTRRLCPNSPVAYEDSTPRAVAFGNSMRAQLLIQEESAALK